MADDEHIFGDRRDVAGQPVVIAMPKGSPAGLTFLLTAANISLAKYLSIRDALLKIDQIVVGFYINALNPPRNNHRVKAEKVREMWKELRGEYRMRNYNIVGHSVGGKIALLVAAAYDDDASVRSIVALDPVDQTPPEFTNADPAMNLSLGDVKANIAMTFTDTGFFVKKEHNARAINRANRETKLINHRNAGHMCYCDDDPRGIKGLSWKAVMPSGNEERNSVAKKEALRIITNEIASALQKGTKSAGGMIKKAKKAVTEEFDSMTKEAKKATGGVQGKAAKGFLKSSLQGVGL